MSIYYCNECHDEAYVRFLRSGEIKPQPDLGLSTKEAQALYRIIENEWINRDDPEAMQVADKISKFVREKKNVSDTPQKAS